MQTTPPRNPKPPHHTHPYGDHVHGGTSSMVVMGDDHLLTGMEDEVGGTHTGQSHFGFPKRSPLLDPNQVAEALLQQVLKEGTLSEGLLLALTVVFSSQVLVAALEMVDNNSVVQYVAQPSQRFFFQISSKHGKSSKHYFCFERYCSCPAYLYQVVMKGDSDYCKHLLAARLAFAIGKCQLRTIPDEHYAGMLESS